MKSAVRTGGAVMPIELASKASQLAVVPPLLPAQLHVHGPVPLTGETAPVPQSPVVGLLLSIAPLDAPQLPLMGLCLALALLERTRTSEHTRTNSLPNIRMVRPQEYCYFSKFANR